MKWLPFICLLLLSASCIDFDRSKYIEEIDSSINELSEAKAQLNQAIFDSIPLILKEIDLVQNRIRTNIKQDSLSLETAIDVDNYKKVENNLIDIEERISVMQKDINAILQDLHNLKKDIENNTGDRAKYEANIQLEKENVKILLNAVEFYTTTCNASFDTFHSVHESLDGYSNLLEMKNKEQNLIP